MRVIPSTRGFSFMYLAVKANSVAYSERDIQISAEEVEVPVLLRVGVAEEIGYLRNQSFNLELGWIRGELFGKIKASDCSFCGSEEFAHSHECVACSAKSRCHALQYKDGLVVRPYRITPTLWVAPILDNDTY